MSKESDVTKNPASEEFPEAPKMVISARLALKLVPLVPITIFAIQIGAWAYAEGVAANVWNGIAYAALVAWGYLIVVSALMGNTIKDAVLVNTIKPVPKDVQEAREEYMAKLAKEVLEEAEKPSKPKRSEHPAAPRKKPSTQSRSSTSRKPRKGEGRTGNLFGKSEGSTPLKAELPEAEFERSCVEYAAANDSIARIVRPN